MSSPDNKLVHGMTRANAWQRCLHRETDGIASHRTGFSGRRTILAVSQNEEPVGPGPKWTWGPAAVQCEAGPQWDMLASGSCRLDAPHEGIEVLCPMHVGGLGVDASVAEARSSLDLQVEQGGKAFKGPIQSKPWAPGMDPYSGPQYIPIRGP